MSKKKLAKDALKSFLKTVKKIKSFDLKKTFTEDGKTYSKLSLIVKHKKGDIPELKLETKSKKDDKKTDKTKSKKSKSKSKGKKKVKTEVVKAAKPSPATVKVRPQKTKSKPADKPKAEAVKVEVVKPATPKVEAAKPATAKVEPTKPATAKVETTKPATAKVEATKTVATAKPTPAKPSKAKVVKPVAKAPVKRVVRTRKPTVGDNLKLIEGIGPKIESFLKEDGIDTFEKLSKAIPEEIQKMMVAKGGTRYNANNPGTWPEQANLAAKGEMEALKALKLELKSGKRA